MDEVGQRTDEVMRHRSIEANASANQASGWPLPAMAQDGEVLTLVLMGQVKHACRTGRLGTINAMTLSTGQEDEIARAQLHCRCVTRSGPANFGPDELVNGSLYVNTLGSSRKARNIAANPNVAVCIPVRRVPVGPPSTIHFQTQATLLDVDAPEIADLVGKGQLRSITSHGELELEDGCFVRLRLPKQVLTHGLGMSLWKLIRDPLTAGRIVALR